MRGPFDTFLCPVASHFYDLHPQKKTVIALGADNGFCFVLYGKITPLSTPCLVVDKYTDYEDNNANKVVKGD